MHREAWGRYLRRRLSEVVERLRGRFAATFDRGDPLTSYALARDEVLGVAPDPAWFMTYDELPESVMHELIQQWLAERSPAEEVATPLSVPLGEVRSRNGAQLVKFWTTYAPLLSALVRRQNEAVMPEVRQAWGTRRKHEMDSSRGRVIPGGSTSEPSTIRPLRNGWSEPACGLQTSQRIQPPVLGACQRRACAASRIAQMPIVRRGNVAGLRSSSLAPVFRR